MEKIDILYDAMWCKRVGKVIEKEIRVNTEDYPVEGWRVVEVDREGNVLCREVPFQYEPLNEVKLSSGLMILYLEEESTAPRRYFNLLLKDSTPSISTRVELLDDGFMWKDQSSYVIKTDTCKYIFHKACGGFASIFDKDGNDWISYENFGGSDGKYRGIPNLVFTSAGGTFHPGSLGCESEIVCSGPLKITIISDSKEFGFTVRWDIYPEHATMTVLKHSLTYWFLYEGTPGGNFEEDRDYIVLPNEEIKPASEIWHANGVPWLIFGDGASDRGLYLVRHNELPDIEDSYWPMEQNMTVWGFGRARKELPLATYFDDDAVKISIGFVEDAKSKSAVDRVNSIKNKDRVL